MPEALLGGYPKGEIFGTRLGYRLPEGREAYARYNAIDVPGPETEALAGLSQRTGASLVVGVIERGGSTLYCTALYFEPSAGLVAKHRKLMPTGTERLIWGQGDGSHLPVVDTPAGRVGGAICWENHMPLLRAAMYAKGVQIWCARHRGRARHLAMLDAPHRPRRPLLRDQRLPGAALARRAGPGRAGLGQPASADQRRLGHHRPAGRRAGRPAAWPDGPADRPHRHRRAGRARYDFDVSGHYARPDIFSLTVDERARPAVRFLS